MTEPLAPIPDYTPADTAKAPIPVAWVGRLLLTRTQAAEHIGVTLRTLDRWVEEGKLRVIRDSGGAVYRFHPAALDADLLALCSAGRESVAAPEEQTSNRVLEAARAAGWREVPASTQTRRKKEWASR